jgi:hypothetical protein
MRLKPRQSPEFLYSATLAAGKQRGAIRVISSRYRILKKRSLWICSAAAVAVAAALAGCGTTTYFDGRTLPPSGLQYRVMIAVQNPTSGVSGSLGIVDAFYDIRFKYNSTNTSPAYTVAGFSGKLPISIQNMPEELEGLVYGFGDGSLAIISYAKESSVGGAVGLPGLSSSIFGTRNGNFTFAANQESGKFTVLDKSAGGPYSMSLPGVYRVSVNPGGSAALAFVQNSNYVYYARKLTAVQTAAYSGGYSTWPKNAMDCQPFNDPVWCVFQAQSPDHTAQDAAGVTYYWGAPLTFDRPVKAVFSSDGGTAYVLNCGPECGGTTASVTPLPVGPMIFLLGEQSGNLPTQIALNSSTLAIPGGASNALVDSSTMYVVGQQPQTVLGQKLFAGNLTVVTLPTGATTTLTASSAIPISDGAPGAVSRMVEGDDNTLWISMTKCIDGVKAATGQPYGCLTMVNTTTNTATLLPYIGDATGVTAVTGLHKIYTVEGNQVYIYSTVDGLAIDNQYVTVTGTAYDVAYMDAISDADNTVY